MRRIAYISIFSCLGSLSCHSQASAQVNKYQLSDAEKIACISDAQRLCSDTYPDEDKLMACMKLNRKALTSECRLG